MVFKEGIRKGSPSSWVNPYELKVQAIGGTHTIANGYHYHIFTESASLKVLSPGFLDILLVGGGGSAGAMYTSFYNNNLVRAWWGGYGGAGGVVDASKKFITPGIHPIIIGAGGIRNYNTGQNGGDSSFNGLIALGGGYGGNANPNGTGNSGNSGGCGGGGGSGDIGYSLSMGGLALQPSSASGGYGYPGGSGDRKAYDFTGHANGGQGGGAGSAGLNGADYAFLYWPDLAVASNGLNEWGPTPRVVSVGGTLNVPNSGNGAIHIINEGFDIDYYHSYGSSGIVIVRYPV